MFGVGTDLPRNLRVLHVLACAAVVGGRIESVSMVFI